MAPGMKAADAVRIAVAGSDASRSEVVVVPVPHGLARPRDSHVEAREQSRETEVRREEEVAIRGSIERPIQRDVRPESARVSRMRFK